MPPTFLLGCQRSGTTALLEAFAQSPDVRVFGEDDPEVMHDFRLRPAADVLPVLAATPQHAVLKPICESQHADRLLAALPEARVLWLYRAVRDVVASARRKWPGHLLEVAARLRARDLAWLDWRAERLGPGQWDQLDTLLRPDLSEPEAAAVFWWVRNQWFFAHGLAADPRVLLVRYEDLATAPVEVLERLFGFAGIPFAARYAATYHAESVGKGPELVLAPAIQRACDDLWQRLAACR